MIRDKTSAGTFLVLLASVFAAVALLASPASAQVSGGAFAENGSVASGTADAHNQSTASGDATARNQSTASGCSTAVNQSTASGAACPRPTPPPTRVEKEDDGKKGGAGGGATTARAATGTSARLALTGSWTAPLAAMAALAVAFGLWLVVATDRRTRTA